MQAQILVTMIGWCDEGFETIHLWQCFHAWSLVHDLELELSNEYVQ